MNEHSNLNKILYSVKKTNITRRYPFIIYCLSGDYRCLTWYLLEFTRIIYVHVVWRLSF